jgi:hypothetical protein
MERQPARNFQDLIVWQKAHQFVLSVYRFTNCFPKAETYGSRRSFDERLFQFRPTSPKVSRKAADRTKCGS